MESIKTQEIFSVPHAIRVIFACENNGNITQITKKLNLSSTTLIYPAIKRLVELEIIKRETIIKRGYRVHLNLTEKGKKILAKLKDIEALL